MEEDAAGNEPLPERFHTPYSAESLKMQALNSKDSLPQFSLTPHPSLLTKEELENILEHSFRPPSLQRPKIIRICTIEVYDSRDQPSSLTPSKPIIKPPRLDSHAGRSSRQQSWQLNLSPADPIRANPFPSEGKIVLLLQHDRYIGNFNQENLMEEEEEEEEEGRDGMRKNGGHSTCSYVIPLAHERTGERHLLFNHIQVSVEGEDLNRVTKVRLLYIPQGRSVVDVPMADISNMARRDSLPMIFDTNNVGNMNITNVDTNNNNNNMFMVAARKRQRPPEEEEKEKNGKDDEDNNKREGKTTQREDPTTKAEREMKKLKMDDGKNHHE